MTAWNRSAAASWDNSISRDWIGAGLPALSRSDREKLPAQPLQPPYPASGSIAPGDLDSVEAGWQIWNSSAEETIKSKFAGYRIQLGGWDGAFWSNRRESRPSS